MEGEEFKDDETEKEATPEVVVKMGGVCSWMCGMCPYAPSCPEARIMSGESETATSSISEDVTFGDSGSNMSSVFETGKSLTDLFDARRVVETVADTNASRSETVQGENERSFEKTGVGVFDKFSDDVMISARDYRVEVRKAENERDMARSGDVERKVSDVDEKITVKRMDTVAVTDKEIGVVSVAGKETVDTKNTSPTSKDTLRKQSRSRESTSGRVAKNTEFIKRNSEALAPTEKVSSKPKIEVVTKVVPVVEKDRGEEIVVATHSDKPQKWEEGVTIKIRDEVVTKIESTNLVNEAVVDELAQETNRDIPSDNIEMDSIIIEKPSDSPEAIKTVEKEKESKNTKKKVAIRQNEPAKKKVNPATKQTKTTRTKRTKRKDVAVEKKMPETRKEKAELKELINMTTAVQSLSLIEESSKITTLEKISEESIANKPEQETTMKVVRVFSMEEAPERHDEPKVVEKERQTIEMEGESTVEVNKVQRAMTWSENKTYVIEHNEKIERFVNLAELVRQKEESKRSVIERKGARAILNSLDYINPEEDQLKRSSVVMVAYEIQRHIGELLVRLFIVGAKRSLVN